MIKQKTINGQIFVEQTTFYVYASKEDRKRDKWTMSTSDKSLFKELKKNAKEGRH